MSSRARNFCVTLLGVVVGVALLAAPAQAASFQITVEADPISDPIPIGERATTQVRVSIASQDNMVCAQDADVAIALEAAGQAPDNGFVADISPTTLTFTVPVGVHGPNGGWESDSQPAELTVEVTDAADPALHPGHSFKPTATFSGETPSGCHATQWDENSGSTDVAVQIPPAPEEPDDDGGAPSDDDGDGSTPDGDEESPAPGVALVLVLAALVALARRRR